MPAPAGLTVCPIKSLDGIALSAATLTAGGALAGDRRFALCDAAGTVCRAKEWPALHRLRALHARVGGG